MIENILHDLIISRFGTLSAFSAAAGLPVSTLKTILTRGVDRATIKNLKLICSALGLSLDALALGRLAASSSDASEPVDVADALQLLNSRDLLAGGRILSARDKALLLDMIAASVEIVTKQAPDL